MDDVRKRYSRSEKFTDQQVQEFLDLFYAMGYREVEDILSSSGGDHREEELCLSSGDKDS